MMANKRLCRHASSLLSPYTMVPTPIAATGSSCLSQRTSVPCSRAALLQAKCFSSERLARLFALELNRARAEYRRTPTKAQQEACLRTIASVPLQQVRGLDGKTVAQCLTTLVTLDAPADMPIIHDCAVWISVHPDALSPHSLAQSLYSLVCLEYSDSASVVCAVRQQLLSAMEDMAASSICMVLAAVLTSYATPARGQLAAGAGKGSEEGVSGTLQLPMDMSQLAERALPFMDESLGLTEKAMVAVALGKYLSQTATATWTEGLIADRIMAQLSAVVWGCIPGAELSVLSMADIVGIVSVLHVVPLPIRDSVATAALQELKTRVCNQSLESSRSVVQVARVLSCLCNVNRECVYYSASQDVLEKVVSALETYVASDAITLDAAAKLLEEFSKITGSSIATPPALTRYLVRAINGSKEKWDAQSVRTVLSVFSKDSSLQADAQALATRRVELIKSKCTAGASVDASDVAALLVEGIVDPHAELLAETVTNNISRWSVSQVMTFLQAAARVNGKPTNAIMRDVASKLVPCMEKATAAQVAAVMSSYGRARVRNDAFCAAVTSRAALLGPELTLQQISTILGGLAAVEYRDTKLFLDVAPTVIAQSATADATQTANLLAAYAKMLVWNFKVIWSLAERASVIHEQFTLTQVFAVVASLNRMDVQHDVLVQALLRKAIRCASDDPNLPLPDVVMILSAFSRSGVWDATLFADLGKRVVQQQQSLTPEELAETLMAFARVGLTQYNIFDELTLRALAVAPTCSLMALANVSVAYATIGCKHEELFSIIADRFVNQKLDVPAVTIASVLSAFAAIGIRNDRLFIEAIPRVRHVGQYGTPKDITNVVYAYSQVGLWHYKLFVRLADRAVQLRGEFRCDQLARLLEAYARVDMRYEKLFVEFSPRVQTVAHLLTAGEISTVVNAYAKVRVLDTAVFKACVDRAQEVLNSFEQSEAALLVGALRKAKFDHEGLAVSLGKMFPGMMASLQQVEDEEREVGTTPAGGNEGDETILVNSNDLGSSVVEAADGGASA
ncbi:hypothetical protein, conserved [Trypanosoma brucei gambiense DAL972]|uniref:RNA-editing substrate-binding complex 6 protein domain-containing protein n=1 Tax=Trypanosoma brucei gambiense (strain MHOM/CI/86/DAL972) TaxID=679716 RepID=D0A4C8_TRYB9|nr:hypothetical protein, conserved [Trypanosoma brucei gambiense DAL972]CBH16122.1 hypothetical protein, conserved [Trypanosoma brucei gambiense DAL972]|eukprot:XP_011778386.1 hypothetical protein, conserved [Trypanosoma brucei gambiense DAL972]